MPSNQPNGARNARRRAILDLVGKHRLKSQGALGDLLAARGIGANQATLSRDLRDLGVVKGPAGYELPAQPPGGHAGGAAGLWHAVKEWLVEADVAQNQVILHTPPSGAAPLASALDHGEVPQLLGTIAGDDTVLVICKDPRKARSLARELVSMRGGVP
jgi:transcriptional regulator of arginine metabolism